MISTGTLGLMLSSVFLQLYSALFEVAIDVLKRAKNLGEPASILEAIVATDYHSVVGPIKWSGKPVKNVSKTPPVAGQWRKRSLQIRLLDSALFLSSLAMIANSSAVAARCGLSARIHVLHHDACVEQISAQVFASSVAISRSVI
jgi:hypothetical protein